MSHTIIISGMVCQRCVMVVQDILNRHELPYAAVQIGQIITDHPYSQASVDELSSALKSVGFEIVTGRVEQLMTNIKARVRQYIEEAALKELPNLSTYITSEIFYDYSYLSDLFSAAENKSIEQYFIELRIDKAKELLVYTSQSLTNIAYELGFSSPQHFANHFKQHSGQTPSAFRKLHAMKK